MPLSVCGHPAARQLARYCVDFLRQQVWIIAHASGVRTMKHEADLLWQLAENQRRLQEKVDSFDKYDWEKD